jgi:hypothetical protein
MTVASLNRTLLRVHEGQRRVLSDPRRFRVVVAGRRWGKTQTAKTAILKRSRIPKQIIWYVAPTYRMARSIMWAELIDSIPARLIKRKHETLMLIELVNGTLIELKGADKPDTLRGVALHFLILDEVQDMKPETWFKVLRPTLASTKGDAIFIGTPKAFNWLYDLYMLGQRGNYYTDAKGRRRLNQWKSWQFPTKTSPFIAPSEIEAAKEDMDEKSYLQEFEASFETMSGRVYYAFDRRIHVGKYDFNPTLPIWIGMDFNIDPMSAVIMQPQPSGEVWIVSELVLFSSNTQETGDELGRRFHRHLRQTTLYPDPAGANRTTASRGLSDLDILRDCGFKRQKHRKKHPPVADRVNSVNRMFKSANGHIRMRVDVSCKHTIQSLEQTIYKPGTREVDKIASVEHQADALGYCVQFEFPVREVKIAGLSL